MAQRIAMVENEIEKIANQVQKLIVLLYGYGIFMTLLVHLLHHSSGHSTPAGSKNGIGKQETGCRFFDLRKS